MKKIFRHVFQTSVCLFSLGMNPSLWASAPEEALEEERLCIGETSLLATSFVQTIWKLHQKNDAQVVLRDPKFLEGLAKLKNAKHYLPLIAYMSPETKTYLNQNLFTLFPFSSFPTDNPALKIHEYLGAFEQAQMTDTIQQMTQITDTLEGQESTLLAALLSAGYKGPLDEEMFDILNLPSMPPVLEVQDEIKMPETLITPTPVVPMQPVLTIETILRELEDISKRLAALAIETQSIEMTHTADGVMQALYFGRLAQQAVRNGSQEKDQEYFERLEHITKHLSESE